MNFDHSIVVITENNHSDIDKRLNQLCAYSKQGHHSLKEIVIIDNASIDDTRKKIISSARKNHKIKLYALSHRVGFKSALIMATKRCFSNKIIVLEPHPYTKMMQVENQNYLLNRHDIVFPSRYHDASLVSWKNKQEELNHRTINLLIHSRINKKLTDFTLDNFSFRKNELKKILSSIENPDMPFFKLEIYLKSLKQGLNTRVCPTHYFQEPEIKKDFIERSVDVIRKINKIKNLTA